MLKKQKGLEFTVNLNYTCMFRLHKEALKQAATDPKTGIIDVSILTTGVSTSERQRRESLAKELHNLLRSRGKGGVAMKYTEIFEVMKENSQIVSLLMSLFTIKRLNVAFSFVY